MLAYLCHFVFQVQSRFEVDIKELPEQIDTSTYSKITTSLQKVDLVLTKRIVNLAPFFFLKKRKKRNYYVNHFCDCYFDSLMFGN
jgi:hypothetical protein